MHLGRCRDTYTVGCRKVKRCRQDTVEIREEEKGIWVLLGAEE